MTARAAAVGAASVERPPAQVGRFELGRMLGQGAQATVWLGFDRRLDREVAVKLMRASAAAQPAGVDRWLDEARSVSRLQHPHIVRVFEADVHAGQPYLVFEYVAGKTLSELLRERGAMPAAAAAAMMADVLDALEAAHAAGVVHRDLKPSNILVDAKGHARVMDFGIAARMTPGQGASALAGTPGYMSPEAADGQPPAASMDVFAAAVVLVEMLSGKPLIAERDPYRAIYRAAHEDLALPPGLPKEVDDNLRAILLRALARDPAQRTPGAAALRDALRKWGEPRPEAGAAGGDSDTLGFLLRRMRRKSDFPALSDAVARIQRVANSEKENLHSLSAEILKDVALTNKLLRLVNSANYSHAGGGTISTVSRAVALVGFAGIRNMALSLVLLEHMHDKAHANQLKEEFLRALMAGSLAGALAPMARETEEAFIGAMFQNLGRLLTEFYFPEEARQVRGALATSRRAGVASDDPETAAAVAVLGLSFEELGVGVAKSWGLPEGLQRCMRKPAGDPPTRMPDKPGERLRWITLAANTLADTMLSADPAQAPQQLAEVAQRFAPSLGLAVRDVQAATEQARQRLVQLAQAMNLQVAASSPARRLLNAPVEPAAGALAVDSLSEHQLQATVVPADAAAPTPRDNAAQVLASGVADITNSMVDGFRLNEVLRMILETMFRALGFRRVVFCLRDAKTNTITGRFGLGEGAEAVAAAFKLPLAPGATDLFHAVCSKGADTLISDATVANIASRLPPWFRRSVDAPAFLLLPLMIKGAPFGLIYADMDKPGGIELGERELSLLRTLRNQAVMAFKQAG
jgi:serine/threonine protein kinase